MSLLDGLNTEDKSTIVNAINEILGKYLIADSIGEPLDASGTFSAMSNDINSLLNTFKTNMINNGITVESGDKFKQLINKIATLAEKNTELRDSLASILKDEGVNVTEEDDIASLIIKTDEEFQDNTTILYNKMKDANYNVDSSMNMDTLLNKLILSSNSEIKGSLTGQGVTNGNIITFTAKDLEFTPSLVFIIARGVSEQIDVTESIYYNTLTVTNEDVFIGVSPYNIIEVNTFNNSFKVIFTSGTTGGTYNSLGWKTISTIDYIAIR